MARDFLIGSESSPSHDQMQTETNSDFVLAFSRASRSSCFNFEFLLASFDIFDLL